MVKEHHVLVREQERVEVRDPHVVEIPEQGEPLRQRYRRLQLRTHHWNVITGTYTSSSRTSVPTGLGIRP